jgi:Tat protein translocase TatB subunit
MGFSGIGIWEILLILIVALIVLGPGRLPAIARTLGKTLRAIKKASADLTVNITRELETTKNEPPSQPKEENRSKAEEVPSAISKAEAPGRDDQSTKPGEAPQTK